MGPCLTDAAHEAALDEPLVARRYAVIRTDIAAMIAALNPGGVMKSSGLRLMSSRDEIDIRNIGWPAEMSSRASIEYRLRWSSMLAVLVGTYRI